MWREFLLMMAGFASVFSAPIAISILLMQVVARWGADRIITGRKGTNVREVNQLIDVLMWFRGRVRETDRERIRKLRRLKREVAN
jgi:hypothetical protein